MTSLKIWAFPTIPKPLLFSRPENFNFGFPVLQEPFASEDPDTVVHAIVDTDADERKRPVLAARARGWAEDVPFEVKPYITKTLDRINPEILRLGHRNPVHKSPVLIKFLVG